MNERCLREGEVCFSFVVSIFDGSWDRNWSRNHGGTRVIGFLSVACSTQFAFLCNPGPTCPRVAWHRVCWALPHSALIQKMLHTFLPTILKKTVPELTIPFPNDSGLCLVGKIMHYWPLISVTPHTSLLNHNLSFSYLAPMSHVNKIFTIL